MTFNRVTHFNFCLFMFCPSATVKNIFNEFPTTNQNIVAAAIMGGYFGLYILVTIKGAMSGSKPVPVVVAAAAPTNDSIPDVSSDEFGAFLDSEENVNMFVESFEKE